MDLSLVLPVANQEDHIERVVESFRTSLRPLGLAIELLLVVNNSRDKSLQICSRLAEMHPGEIRTLESGPGWGQAIAAGFGIATGNLVGFANSARTHPEDLVRVIQYATIHEDFLMTSNRLYRESYSFIRHIGSALFNLEARWLFGVRVTDINGNPKIFRRALLPTFDLKEKGSLFDLEILAAAKAAKVPFVQVPVLDTTRHGGRSMTGLRLAATLYWRPWIMKFSGRKRQQ